MSNNLQELRALAEPIRSNPQDRQAWINLANAASNASQWSMALGSFLSALNLDPENTDILDSLHQAHSQFIQENQEKEFFFKIFKTTKHLVIVVLVGLMNVDLKQLEAQMYALTKTSYHKIIFDFTGIHSFSGLAPSLIRKLDRELKAKDGAMGLVNISNPIQQMLKLKNIDTPQYKTLEEATQKMN